MKQNIEESDVCIELRYTLFQTFEEKLVQRVTDIDCSFCRNAFSKNNYFDGFALFIWRRNEIFLCIV